MGDVVREGEVQVFDLIDCAEAQRAYAWSHEVNEGGRRRFIVVLHKPPVDSPLAAVQASIAADYRPDNG